MLIIDTALNRIHAIDTEMKLLPGTKDPKKQPELKKKTPLVKSSLIFFQNWKKMRLSGKHMKTL
jgi:hypothetical protein